MTKRIFKSICIAALGVFFASIILFMVVLFNYFSGIQRNQLKMQTDLASQGVSNEGEKYFEGLEIEDYRITWIDEDGAVLYDSKSDYSVMENHLEREEIIEALDNGLGESVRYSVTLLERSIYCARRLPDGTVLRLSMAQNTPLTLLFGMMQPICTIFAAALILSLVLASRLSKRIVRPLNEINLDEPLNNDGYEEITPLLNRIATQQRQIRRQGDELRRKQSEFETVTKGMSEGIVLLDGKNIILSINPAAVRLFNTTPLCVGKYLLSVNRSLELQELLQKANEGKHSDIIMESGGSKYQFTASPVFSDGLVSGVVLLILDVTEKEKSEQMRREFTANVSHELKTPLHTISGSAELMANGMVKQEDIPVFSKQIYSEAHRMINLIEDIIKLSHLDEGSGDMEYEKVDIYSLSYQTMQSLLPEAVSAGVNVKMFGNPAEIYGIRQLLEGIIFNLIDNAIKYNRVNGSVSITVEEDKDNVILLVSDTGIGIPVEHQERIFERFYRVDKSHSKEIGGTGLGLSIVKHAAKLHDADIEVESETGIGTSVKISFPKSAH